MMNEKLNNSNKTTLIVAKPHSGKDGNDESCHCDTPAVSARNTGEVESHKPSTGMERAKDAAAQVASSMTEAATYMGHKAQDVTVSVGAALENTGHFLKSKLEGAPKIENLRDFYIEELRDLYSAENQLLKTLPKMAAMASSVALNEVLEHHLEQTRGHLGRLDEIFRTIGVTPAGKRCRAMEGIVMEAEELLADEMPSAVKDAAIIAAAQRMEHYEMAGYGCVRTYARILGEHKAADLLDEILQEEGTADVKLSAIAEGTVNLEAAVGL